MPRKRGGPAVPVKPKGAAAPNLLLLDRFSEADLRAWGKHSGDLDELNRLLYFGLEPERIRRRDEILAALLEKPAPAIDFDCWVRFVEYQWALHPLSSAGSIRSFGGRFNIGMDVDECINARPFPALYLGDCHETSYREFFQREQGDVSGGLTPQDLALTRSYTAVRMRGRVERVFDVSDINALKPIASVFAKFKTPPQLTPIARRFNIGPAAALLVRTPTRLQEILQDQNWRSWPTQFGLPSPSQKFGELLLAAGYEAVRYRSSKKHGGICLAILSSNMGTGSFVELVDQAPEGALIRLDMDSADSLAGWNHVPASLRPLKK